MQLPEPVSDAPGLFRCVPEGMMRGVFAGASLREIVQREVTGALEFETPEEYWRMMTEVAAPVVAGLAKADANARETIRSEVIELVSAASKNGPGSLQSTAVVISGVR